MGGPYNSGNNPKLIAILIDCLNLSYDEPSSPPLLNRRWLPSQHVLHNVITSINKGKKPTHGVATISVDD